MSIGVSIEMNEKKTCMSVAKLIVLAPSKYVFPSLLLRSYLLLVLLKSCSSLIGVVSLVLQVRERGERAGSEPVELVLEEHDFLFLLLDDIEELALVSDLLDSLGGVGGAVLVGVGLEAHDLLPLVHVLLELARLVVELLVLEVLLPDLTLQLRLRHVERLDALGCVGFELLDLALEPLLVFLVTLNVWTRLAALDSSCLIWLSSRFLSSSSLFWCLPWMISCVALVTRYSCTSLARSMKSRICSRRRLFSYSTCFKLVLYVRIF